MVDPLFASTERVGTVLGLAHHEAARLPVGLVAALVAALDARQGVVAIIDALRDADAATINRVAEYAREAAGA